MKTAGRPRIARPAHPAHAEGRRRDAELVDAVLGGRREDFAELVRRHQATLFRHARGMGIGRDAAEDLVQDAFVRAYTSLSGCRQPERFGLWVFRIFRHRCLDHLKDIRRRTVPLEDVTLFSDRGRPEAEAARTELRDDLVQALDGLGDDLREAFLMKHHEDRDYEEMADITGASVSALKMRVHRAREALQQALAGLDGKAV